MTAALDHAQFVGGQEIDEADAVDTERALRGEPPKRQATIKRVGALREIASAVQRLTVEGKS